MVNNIKHTILVLSGKGGVGKSTIATQVALILKERGLKVGVLDLDLCGPNVPYMLGLENGAIHQSEGGMVPVYSDANKNLGVVSMSYLLKHPNDSVVWRGPKKTAMVKDFLTNVLWGNLDYLIIDTPPGTSDEHITVMQCISDTGIACDGAVIVTSPQMVAIEDVRKEITFCQKTGITIIGIVENMSAFVCPSCQHCTNIFSTGGGVALAAASHIPLLGVLPLDNCATGMPHVPATKLMPDATFATGMNEIVDKIIAHSQAYL